MKQNSTDNLFGTCEITGHYWTEAMTKKVRESVFRQLFGQPSMPRSKVERSIFRDNPLKWLRGGHKSIASAIRTQGLLGISDTDAERFTGIRKDKWPAKAKRSDVITLDYMLALYWVRNRADRLIRRLSISPSQAERILGWERGEWSNKHRSGDITGQDLTILAVTKKYPKSVANKKLLNSPVCTRASLGISTSDAASLMGWEHDKWKNLEKQGQITPDNIRALVQAAKAADFSTAKPSELLELRTKLGISAQACDRMLGKTTSWWGNRERGIVATPRFYLKLLEDRFNEQPESHKKAILVAEMRKIARKHGFSLKQIFDQHQESNIAPKVAEISVIIGNNLGPTQYESFNFVDSTYCLKLKQAISEAFPDVDVEVSFTTASQLFEVTADADEENVSEQVQAIHGKLWQLDFSIVSLEDIQHFISSQGITIEDLSPLSLFCRFDWEKRLNGKLPTYAYQLKQLAASFASREEVLQLRRSHQLSIKDFCNWLVIEPSYWLALESGKRRISRKAFDGMAYFLETTKDV
jgi:hypothetical protein